MSTGNSAKVIVIAFLANLGIAIAKLVGAVISGSASLLAEAIHSVVDSSNQILLFIGNKKSQKAPDDEHPLGYGREAFFWSFIVAILLFSLGGLFAIYEGVHKWHSGELSSPWLGLGILIVSLGLEGYSFHACWKEVKEQKREMSLWQWFQKTSSSEVLVIFTEDLAALLGLSIATVCLLLAWFTGDAHWDALGSIVVGALLVVVAILLAVEIKSFIIGEAPHIELRQFLDQEVTRHFPGGRILNHIALQTGTHEVMLSCKIHPGTLTNVKTAIDATNAFERQVRAHFPTIRWQFVELDDQD